MENVRFKKPGDKSLYILELHTLSVFIFVSTAQVKLGHKAICIYLGFNIADNETPGIVYRDACCT